MNQSLEQYSFSTDSLDINSQKEKERIFEIKKYTFLKKKRQEAIEKYQTVRPWSYKEDATLKELMYQSSSFSWKIISAKLKGRTPSQCRDHWKMNLKPEIKKGKWTKEEDDILLKYVEKHGTEWSSLQSLFLQERTTKQIRERWINHFSKNTSQFKWTKALDKALIELYILFGSSWVKIASYIDSTTENMVKNRFYGLLRGTVAKYKKTDKVIGEKVKKIRMDLSAINKDKRDECSDNVKLSDFALYNDGDSFEKIVNNPYIMAKSKNYSLKILIEFLPMLIEDLGIDIRSLSDNKDNYSHIGNNIDNIDISMKMTDDINMNSIDDDDGISMISSYSQCLKLNTQLNLLSKVFEQHDKQKIQSFFSCYRNNALHSFSQI